MIDKNNPDYTSPVQEKIWNAATDLVPPEISHSMIPAKYHESCTQWYTFLTKLLNTMYICPKKEDLEYIYRTISLRTMVIDAGISEPFYPGNG